jgi:hypothetical protein
LLKVYVVFAPTNVNLHVATLAPAQLLHAFFERRNSSLTLQIRCSPVHQHADARHTLCLRTRRNRPCYRAAEQCDELAPLHCLSRGSGQGILPAQLTHLKMWCADGMSAFGKQK